MQQAQGTLSFTELIFNASFLVQLVMLFLLILSLVSWTIIIQRSNQYKIAKRQAMEFEDRFWSGIDLNNLYQDCIKRQDSLIGLEVIYAAGFKEFVRLVNSGPADQEVVMDGTYRQMKVASSREVEALESHLPTLATIGSISPYIGLFGTVWGIMHAFVALAAVKNATLNMVAPPIAEALIATAMGLFAAIPAVMFYNRFVTKVEALENTYLNFMDEFSTILNRRLVTIRSQLLKNDKDGGQSAAHHQNVHGTAAAPVKTRAAMTQSTMSEGTVPQRTMSQSSMSQSSITHNTMAQSTARQELSGHAGAGHSQSAAQTAVKHQSTANTRAPRESASGSYIAPGSISSVYNKAMQDVTDATKGRASLASGAADGTVNVDFLGGFLRPGAHVSSQGYVNAKDSGGINNTQSDEPRYITPGVRKDRGGQ